MTEFLKNDPIALRHCLLYVFLHEGSIDKLFDDFCEIVGPDIINKEEYQFWFDQFEQGKFDDNNEPITDMKDIFRSDKDALRVCVLYESLKLKNPEFKKNNEFIHHSVFSVYMHFCKVIGENVMEYREFDFWFHRFANGVFDLKFERDKEEKIYELMDMPIDIMRDIVKYLDIVDRLSLERTSISLRLFSQDQKVFHDDLTFEANWYGAHIRFEKRGRISYKKKGNDCKIEFGNRKKVLRGVSCLKQAFQDFKRILANPNLYLGTLTIWSSCEESKSLGGCIDPLKLTHPLRVEHISLRTYPPKALLKILPSLKPGYLTTITININLDEAIIGELAEMDQWKQAKYFYMVFKRFVGPLRYLYHFKEFYVSIGKFSEEDALEMKEILLKSADFKKCNLHFLYIANPFSVVQEFGGPIEGRLDTCHYPIPNSTDYFEINVSYKIMKIERKKK